MTRRIRKFIFWVFVSFFIPISIVVSLFAQGWRFDFNTFKIAKTGGIYVKTSVTEAKIYINDKYFKNTNGLLNYAALISGLAPKQYSLFIYKEGYFPWNKTVGVKSGLVTELSHIILLPIEPKKIKVVNLPLQTISEFNINNQLIQIKNNQTKTIKTYNFEGSVVSSEKFKIATSSQEYVVSPDKKKELFVSDGKIWINYLSDEAEEPTKKTGETDLVASYEDQIKFFNWFSDSEHIIWYANNELKIAERDNRGGKRYTVSFYLNVDSPVFWDQQNSDFYFFETGAKTTTLYKINIGS